MKNQNLRVENLNFIYMVNSKYPEIYIPLKRSVLEP